MSEKLWIHREYKDNEVLRLAQQAGISQLLAKVFISRGVSDPGYVRAFVNPGMDGLHSPFLLKDMEKAVDRIVLAIENRERIVIYGDYDVDGVTSTSILLDFLTSVGAEADFYIPDRFDEGYGLSDSAVDNVLKMDASVVITVDCGITAINEINRLNGSRITVIVTDHHECKEVLPEAFAIINPHRPDCVYPFKELAGVGVVFKLIQALCQVLNTGEQYLKYLDLVTLGTVADVVQLLDENRLIVKFGLSAIEKSDNPGLKALIAVSGLKDKSISTYGVGFALAPRINAAGRTGSAERAVKLFSTHNLQLAEEIAGELNEANKYRQQTEAEILQQVIDYVESQVDMECEKVIVAAGKGWHHGIIGIVASRITERYYRPCILISEEDGTGRGSGRSIEGFNLFQALSQCGNLLIKYGGHEMAAGLSLDIANLSEFKKSINDYANTVLTPETLTPRIKIDAMLDKGEITANSVLELELLSPYGPGNPCPVFSMEALKLYEIRTVGDGKHLKLKLGESSFCIDAIAFNMGRQAGDYLVSDIVDLVFTLEINTWNGVQKVQMILKDLRAHNTYVFGCTNDYYLNIDALGKADIIGLEEIIPERSDLTAVYQYIRSNQARIPARENKPVFIAEDLLRLSKVIADRYRVSMNQFKLYKCIEIFEELKLLEKKPFGDNGITIVLMENGKEKVNLEDSALYRKLQGLKIRMVSENEEIPAG
ncbi:MAG: single-stranded-DNA-specific exonuclease RecJ [Ruminiclostridium sp.]|nr:single-stranded-DNA-specific exonuclease RecJ [Ruminiclostridium sp.]